MIWQIRKRADSQCRELADRHYNRQSIGASNFVPPGRCIVLFAETDTGRAYWVSSWPYAEYVMHAWAGAWICSAFRNEGAGLSSSLITSAVACTRQIWGEPPDMGMITFVDQTKVKPKADPGYCYLRAGFKSAGHTKGGLIALQLLPADMPQKAEPFGFQRRLL